MTSPPRPAPEIRVSDPRRPAEPSAAVEEPRPVRAGARRGALPVALLLVGLVAGYGAAGLRHAQDDRASQAAADAVLDLRLSWPGEEVGVAADSSTAAGVVLRRDLSVLNVGGRPVEVLRAELVGGAMTSRGSGRVLPHGEAWTVSLAGPVRCTGGSPAYAPAGSVLRVQARTAAGERAADLPVPAPFLDDLQQTADRACGQVAPEEAVRAESQALSIGEDSATVEVRLLVATADPVDLLRVTSERPGMRVAVRTGDRPPVFPFRLQGGSFPRLDDGSLSSASLLQLEVRVSDCDAARDPSVDSFGPLATLQVQVQGAVGEGSAEVYDQGAVDLLVAQVC